MAAPVVQDLNQIISDLNPVYAPQENLLNQQRSGLGIKYDSQRSALGAEKTQGFNQINNQATGRGLSFSGIPLDEQATYLSTKYLPGIQNIASQQNTEDMSLQTALAQLDSERRLRALDTRQTQQSSLEKYLADERDRQFKEQQAALDRQATASQNSANNPQEDVQIVKNNAGGWKVLVNGQPSNQYDLATAASLTGKSVLSLLQGGSESDKKAYENYARTGDVAALKRNTGAFYLGGAFTGA